MIKEVKHRRSSLINRAQVRKFLLELARVTGRTRFERVSASTLDQIEASVRSNCSARVHAAPSLGKTL